MPSYLPNKFESFESCMAFNQNCLISTRKLYRVSVLRAEVLFSCIKSTPASLYQIDSLLPIQKGYKKTFFSKPPGKQKLCYFFMYKVVRRPLERKDKKERISSKYATI